MATEVNVLRVFADAQGKFGNRLGVISGAVPANDRQRVAAELGFSDTIFIDDPIPGFGAVRAEIFTPAVDLLFTGHPAVGAAWWLRERGKPIRSLQFRAGVVEIRYVGELVTAEVSPNGLPNSRCVNCARLAMSSKPAPTITWTVYRIICGRGSTNRRGTYDLARSHQNLA